MDNRAMMDAYSYLHGPTVQQANLEIKEILERQFKKSMIMDYIIKRNINDEVLKYGGIGSYTGWHVITKQNILKKSKEDYLKKRISMNIIKLKCVVKMIIWFKKFIENYYKPNGVFVKKTKQSEYWVNSK
jgi:hypothetical protein